MTCFDFRGQRSKVKSHDHSREQAVEVVKASMLTLELRNPTSSFFQMCDAITDQIT